MYMMTEQEREYRTERMVRAMAECNSLTLECKTTGQIARRLRMTVKQLYRRLEDLGSLRRVARLLLFRNTQEGHVDQMSVSGIIGQNRLRVFPFILDIDRYTFALKGEQIFENKFDYHASVLSSPLPFRLGVNIFGKDFKDWRFRLGRAQYRNRNLPVFDASLDEMQLNLASSIRDIFAKGVERAMRETAFRREQLDATDDGGEELSFEEQMDLEAQIIALETDIQTAELEAEIGALFN